MYIILVNDDNTLVASKKERIMQRSKLFDTLWFLANPIYKGYEMSECTVMLEYVLPVSKKYCSEILTLSDDTYEEYLKYELPIDTSLTSEAGDIELQLTFIYADLGIGGQPLQRVRKTSTTTLTIVPISAWSDIIPDSALSAIDQRLIAANAQMQQMIAAHTSLNNTKADGLKYVNNELQLMSGTTAIGNKVVINSYDDGDLGEGVPVVDSNADNIVEF